MAIVTTTTGVVPPETGDGWFYRQPSEGWLGRSVPPEMPCLLDAAMAQARMEGRTGPIVLHLSCPCPKCSPQCMGVTP